jgi:hypothetical protein
MLNRSVLNEQDWTAVRDTPHLVALAVMTAGNSGILGSMQEAMTAAKAFFDASKGSNELFKDIANQESMTKVREELKAKSSELTPESLEQSAIRGVHAALAAIRKNGSAEDEAAYKAWLTEIAEKIANAAKEGGFLGFGGERVSEAEKAVIAKIEAAIAEGTAGAASA